jgi:hypothetical protein
MRGRYILLQLVAVAVFCALLLPSSAGQGDLSSGSCIPEPERYADFNDYIVDLYDDLGLEGSLDYQVFEFAVIGRYNLMRKRLLSRDSILTVIDYTKPSTEERFFVIDLEARILLYRSLVAHGRNSGDDCADSFSNVPGSLQTSLGFYVTGPDYVGVHGKALKLEGVDNLFNGNAEERCIVVHGAWYCTEDFVEEYGRLGRSWGCPVLPPDVSEEIIDTIKRGTALFAYFKDDDYLTHSEFLNIDNAVLEFRKDRVDRG